MRSRTTIPINTLDRALEQARALSRDLTNRESKACRGLRIFSALASDESEGLAAFLIWRARGETIQELARYR